MEEKEPGRIRKWSRNRYNWLKEHKAPMAGIVVATAAAIWSSLRLAGKLRG